MATTVRYLTTTESIAANLATVDGNAYPVIPTTSAPGGGGNLAPPASSQKGVDYNSLILGDLTDLRWNILNAATNAPHIAPNAAVGPDGYIDAVEANFDEAAPGRGEKDAIWLPPTGVTEVTVAIPFMLPAGATATNNVGLQITDPTITTVDAQTYGLPPASWGALSIDFACTPGTEYAMRTLTQTNGITVPGGQQSVLWGRPSVTPKTSSDPFWKTPFLRYNVFAKDLLDNPYVNGTGLDAGTGGGIILSRYEYHAQSASWVIDTNASEIAVQYFDWGTPSESAIVVMVNGRAWALIGTGGTEANRIAQVTLPAGLNRVSVFSTAQQTNAASAGFAQVNGMFLMAVYIPADAYQVRPPKRGLDDCVLVHGTSKDAGLIGTALGTPDLQGYIQPLRDDNLFASLVSLAAGARSLWWDYTVGGNSIVPLVMTMCASGNLTHALLNVYRNDWGGQGLASPWGAGDLAQWKAQQQAVISGIARARPTCQIWLLTTTPETNEGANLSGTTLAQYNAAVAQLVTDNAGLPTPPKLLDLYSMMNALGWTSATAHLFTSAGGIHPTPTSYALVANAIQTSVREGSANAGNTTPPFLQEEGPATTQTGATVDVSTVGSLAGAVLVEVAVNVDLLTSAVGGVTLQLLVDGVATGFKPFFLGTTSVQNQQLVQKLQVTSDAHTYGYELHVASGTVTVSADDSLISVTPLGFPR